MDFLENLKQQFNQQKETEFQRFLLSKTSLEKIIHRKIVQNIQQNYTPSQKFLLAFNTEYCQHLESIQGDSEKLKEFDTVYRMISSYPFQHTINIETNDILKEGETRIPDFLWKQPYIRGLSIQYQAYQNFLKYQKKSICKQFSKLKNLQKFVFSSAYNLPSLEDSQLILDSIHKDKILYLELSIGQQWGMSKEIQMEISEYFFKSIAKFKNLQGFSLRLVQEFQEQYIYSLSNSLKQLQNLKLLEFCAQREFSAQFQEKFFENLKNSVQISEFRYLLYSDLSSEIVDSFNGFLDSQKQLVSLYIYQLPILENQQYQFLNQIIGQISLQKKLEKLSITLSKYEFNSDEFGKMVDFICLIPKLKKLSLKDDNNFSIMCQKQSILQKLSGLEKLQYLNLVLYNENNYIDTELDQFIMEAQEKITNLEVLDFLFQGGFGGYQILQDNSDPKDFLNSKYQQQKCLVRFRYYTY